MAKRSKHDPYDHLPQEDYAPSAPVGGKLIARHVVEQLEHSPAYHDAYGARSGSMWRNFQEHLVKRLDTLERQ